MIRLYSPLTLRNQNRRGFGGGGQQSSSSTSGPWSGQVPYLNQVFSSAQGQYNDYTPQYYGFSGTAGGTPTQTGDSTVSPMNSMETNALNQTSNLGTNGSSALNAANTSMTNILSGDPANNSAILSGVVPQLTSQFTGGGLSDNPNVANAVSQGATQALLNNQNQAANTANTLYNTQLGGAQAAYGAGQQQQNQDQNVLTNKVNAYNYYQQLPYTQLNQYANLVNGQYGSTTTTSQPQQSPFGSLFSDRRLKEDIKPIGKADNGLTIYSYRYKGHNATHLGFMADEVEKLHPEAVSECDGFKMVDYSKAVEA